MDLIVEDGSNVTNANSYVTEEDFLNYVKTRGLELTSDADVKPFIIRAMDYVEGKDYLGSKTYKGQSLKFPREGIHVDGDEIDKASVPDLIKKAVCQLAYDASSQDLMPTVDGKVVVRERVEGAVDVSYDANTSSPFATFTQAESFLSKLYALNSLGILGVRRA